MPNALLPIGKPPGATANPNITWHPRGPSALLGFVSVHGAFRNFAPEAAKSIKGRVLILHGAEDPVAPMDELNAVISQFRAAKMDFEVNLYRRHRARVYEPAEPLRGARR